ncbi:MAG: hypothetical protein BGO78_00060 [Chloroflexi bacterium 44-23]|nr:MAG: hypothetical protein BGO78_00060 [Chloroflexi bacterium 44-23]
MDISFAIVTYNSGEFLKECLRSLIASLDSSFQYEITVIDNGSVDEMTMEVKIEFPQIHWIQNMENVGYSRAMNQGLMQSFGRYVVQLNPDIFVHKDAFQKMIAYMDANPSVGICSPKVLNRDGSLQKQCHRSYARPWDVLTYFLQLDRLFPKSKLFGRYLLSYLPEDQISDVEAVSGSCMVIRKEVIDQIGYLDEQFFAYQEDTDFCYRANEKGWRIVYYPPANITHYGGMGGSLTEPIKAINAWHRSYFLYYRKHLAKQYFFLVNWAMYLAMTIKLAIAYLRFAFTKEKIIGTKKP